MPENAFVDAGDPVTVREAFACRALRQTEMLRETTDVVLGDGDASVAATVAGTFRTIEAHVTQYTPSKWRARRGTRL
jgi:hypothetical protein